MPNHARQGKIMTRWDKSPNRQVRADMARNVLVAKQVSVIYQTRRGPVRALEDLNLSVGQRSFVAIVGPSGCGKTTMLKLFSGLLRPTSGTVQINGISVSGPRPEVGIVFQHPTLMPWKSILNNILMPAQILGLCKARSRERALELLRLVGLEQFAENYPRELSGGMQQRVGLARALIHDPEVLLMDEPFAALDAITREHMALELQSLWLKTGKSILFITHSISEAVFLADKIIVLQARPGRVIEEVSVDIPRERDVDTMTDDHFVDICNHLRKQFEATVKFN